MTEKTSAFLNSWFGKIIAGGVAVGIIAGSVSVDSIMGRGNLGSDQIRKIVSEEVQRGSAPLRAGIMKLAEAQSIQTQNAVLRAMMAAERRAETQQ